MQNRELYEIFLCHSTFFFFFFSFVLYMYVLVIIIETDCRHRLKTTPVLYAIVLFVCYQVQSVYYNYSIRHTSARIEACGATTQML